jgi:hypothetical protein
MWAVVHLFVSDHEEERAREQAREAATGHEHTIAVMAAAPAAAELRVIARRATWALAAREMRRLLGLWTQTVLPPVVTGVIFLAIFGGGLSDRMPAVSGVAYVRFILPGLLVMTVAGQAFANNSTSLVQARTRATSRTC